MLSMVLMATIVMVVVVVASFLKVESSLAAVKQAEAVARLNAMGALRLAGAALQERLGPDTRVSAPASLYDDPAVSSSASPGADAFEYPVLGVWRSWEGGDHDTRTGSRYAGRPQKPDYASKLKAFSPASAPTARFLGWMLSSQMGYANAGFTLPSGTTVKPPAPPSVVTAAGTVPLIGPATDAQAVRQVHAAPISFVDGQPAATTTDDSQGYFSWWVGGENQKVRLIIPNVATASAGSNHLEWAQRAKTFGAPDLEAIGYPALIANAVPLPANQPISPPTLSLLPTPADGSRLTDALKNATPTPLTKAGFHDVSLYSEGLLTNTATGGLRKDLSLFTETWDWANVLDPARQGKMPLFRLKPVKVSRASGDPDYDLAFLRPLPDALFPAGGIGNRRRHALMYWWSDYGSLGGNSAGVASDGGTNFGGYSGLSSFPPIRSWAYLTDYCLHYRKYVTNPDPQLAGVTTMLPPQNPYVTNAGDLYSYYERIHRHPLIARIQYVFASSASGASPAFIAQPVVTLWNPFNVRLTVPSFDAGCKWQSLPIYVGCTDGAGYNVTQHVGAYFSGGVYLRIGGGVNITLDPGQTRVFAMNDRVLTTIPLGSGGTYDLTPGYVASGRSGWQMVLPGTASGAGLLSYRLIKNIDDFGQARDGIYYDYFPANYKYSPVRFSFVGTTTAQFKQLYGQDAASPFQQSVADAAVAPRAFGTFAFGLRLSNDGIAQYDGRTGVKTVSKGFLQASPFTTYTEIGQKSAEVLTAYRYLNANFADTRTQSMAGQIGVESGSSFYSLGNTGVQYAGALNPVNSPYDLYFLPMTGFADANGPQSDPASNYGGFILTGLDPSTGLQRAAIAELPVKPVQSIPGLQGCDIRATNPAPPFHYGLIGNADASPILPPDDAVGRWIDQKGALRSRDEIHQAFLQHDDSYCLNHVLFDDWFFSSLAPLPADWASLRPSAGNEHVWNPAVLDSMKKNWASFVAGTKTLPNSWFLPNESASLFDLGATGTSGFSGVPAQPVAYQRSAAALRVLGQFNVNSTSVVAWRALLGNLRSTSVPYITPGGSTVVTATAANPLARMSIAHEGPVTAGGASGAALGFASLSDAQLEKLAVEIVKQVKARGPFLSLSEFVNRQLASPKPTNPLDPSLNGALGTALTALQNAGSALNPSENAKNIGKTTSKVADFGGLEQKLPLGDWSASTAGPKGNYLHPRAAEGHSTFGLPGWPRQADLLDRLSPVISVRDETFVVRAMGTSPLVNGATAKAWCEAVYQRLPEYVDASIPAHESPLGDANLSPTANDYLINVVLGRRFRLVSFRWLNPADL